MTGGGGGAVTGGGGGSITGGGGGSVAGGGGGSTTGGGGGATGGGGGAAGPDFYPVKQPDLLTSVAGLFTTGGQYVDPNNGVLQDSWSMLVRWQGANFVASPVAYDLGNFTGVQVPAPRTTWQRGPQPEDGGTPGVQLHGYEAGMMISTWSIPHINIVGGGYNDMFGYAWSPSQRPAPFSNGSDLVVQAELAVPTFDSWGFVAGNWAQAPANDTGLYADGQLDLFFYLEDRAHPTLPPIAVVNVAWGNRFGGCTPQGFVGFDYPQGVWFGASGICTTDISTHLYSAPTQTATFSAPQFFRIHITRANWVNLINRINAAGPVSSTITCTPGVSCPMNGYSTNPDDYRLQYAGVIGEAVLLENGSPANTSTIRQLTMGATIRGVGIYQYR